MVAITTDYISAGGNRHPGAADWDVETGVLAFGADNNVALWDPLVSSTQNRQTQKLKSNRLTRIKMIVESMPCWLAMPTK